MRLLIFVMVAGLVVAGGCTPKTEETPAQKTSEKVHGTASKQEVGGEVGMLAVVKKQYLPEYTAVTVGTAIDKYSFFKKTEWTESRNAKGTFYVDVTGWLDSGTLDSRSIKEGVAVRGVQIKFAIHEDGAFGVAMVSKMEAKTDGKVYAYPLGDPKGILSKIYANKEISF